MIEPEYQMEDTAISKAVETSIFEIMMQREEILRAFVAKYGFTPERTVQVHQRVEGGTRWYVRQMTDEEMENRR